MLLKILLAGDGGQGIQLISGLIGQIAFDKGLYITDIPNYGLEQRGGVSLAYLQISDREIGYPKFTKPDYFLIMSDQARDRTTQYHHEKAEIIDIKDYLEKMKAKNVQVFNYNVFFLGMFARILEENGVCKKEEIYKLLDDKLSKKPGWEENRQAFEVGYSIEL